MKNFLKKLEKKLIRILNQYRIHTKLVFLFVICVILPIIVIDLTLFGLTFRAEYSKTTHEMETIATAVSLDFLERIDYAEMISNRFYINSGMNDYLEKEYQSASDYYDSYYFMQQNVLKLVNTNDYFFTFYTDNDSIVPGGSFFSTETANRYEWYKDISDIKKQGLLTIYYDNDKLLNLTPKRTISYIRKLSNFQSSKYEKYVKCNIEYNAIVRELSQKNYSYPIFVCLGDDIIYSNVGHSTISDDFEKINVDENAVERYYFSCKGLDMSVVIVKPQNLLLRTLEHASPATILMLIFSILLPVFLMYLFNKSINQRIYALSEHVSNSDIDNLTTIESVDGDDEIAMLMRNYNKMALRSKELIDSVYKSRIERQEIDLAKQKAELLALESQINPHFLFNLLESIRMHSVIKNEDETADVLAKLSALVRKNVEWIQDDAKIRDEVSFINDYLALQKYRFGDRLVYNVEADEECLDYYLPRLSLVTFVENACVHGMERKAGVCNVDIRVYIKNNMLYLEIEDTGRGMDDETVVMLKEKMNNVTIEMIMNSSHVGILNACLRLKMISKDEVTFDVESEEGLGTYILVKIPVDKLSK